MLRMADLLGAPGIHFHPSDQELIGFFLHNLLVRKQPLRPSHKSVIHECDIFGKEAEPSKIWTKYGGDQLGDEQHLYFFSQLKRLTPKRIDRKAGSGTWSEKDICKRIEQAGNPNPIGLKRKFRYVNKGSKEHGDWRLDEYSLFKRDSKNHCTDYDFDFVICRLRKNERSGVSNNKRKYSSTEKAKIEAGSSTKKPKIEAAGSSTGSQITNVINNTEDESNKWMILVNDIPYDDENMSFTVDELLAETYDGEDGDDLPLQTSEFGFDGEPKEACNPCNTEDVGNQPLDHSCDWESFVNALMADT